MIRCWVIGVLTSHILSDVNFNNASKPFNISRIPDIIPAKLVIGFFQEEMRSKSLTMLFLYVDVKLKMNVVMIKR